VRSGRITLKARAAAPALLMDLEKCSAKKRELDCCGHPDSSISSGIDFKGEELDLASAFLTAVKVRNFVGTRCLAASAQIRPLLQGAAAAEIPGRARTYNAEAKLRHPLAASAKEAGVTTRFFPPPTGSWRNSPARRLSRSALMPTGCTMRAGRPRMP
jgi:hypothetical protein